MNEKREKYIKEKVNAKQNLPACLKYEAGTNPGSGDSCMKHDVKMCWKLTKSYWSLEKKLMFTPWSLFLNWLENESGSRIYGEILESIIYRT